MKENLHRQICTDIQSIGGRALLVGGCVRDHLLGVAAKDIDCEVYGVSPDALCALLSVYGEVDKTGEPFGVYTLKSEGFDFAIARVERRTGSAHTDFEITPIPSLTPRQAAARRDFTVNAIMMDALTGEIIDPYGGADDLKSGVLRAVPGGQFEEDPLRVVRGAQFAARFRLQPDGETLSLMRRMPLDALSARRVMDEAQKALLLSDAPQMFFEVLQAAGALWPWFMELDKAFDSAMRLLGAAAGLRSRAAQPLHFMLAALTHALDRDAAHALLTRLEAGKAAMAYCRNMQPLCRALKTCDEAQRALLLFDGSVCAHDLALLCMAAGAEESLVMEQLARYEAAASRPMPTGRMLLEAGVRPGPQVRRMLAAAREKTLLGMDAQDAVKTVMAESEELTDEVQV